MQQTVYLSSRIYEARSSVNFAEKQGAFSESKKKEVSFLSSKTSCDKFLSFGQSIGLLDSNFWLSDISNNRVPHLQTEDLINVVNKITTPILAQIRNSTLSVGIVPANLLVYVRKRAKAELGLDFDDVLIVGGTVYSILKEWIIRTLLGLGFKDPTFFEALNALPSDTDYRVQVKNASCKDLRKLNNFVLDYLAEQFWEMDKQNELQYYRNLVFKNGLLKFSVQFNETVYSTISFGDLNHDSIDLLFVKSLPRESLFVQDSLQLNITPFLNWLQQFKMQGPFLIETLKAGLLPNLIMPISDLNFPLQAIIDRLGKILRVVNPATCNKEVFFLIGAAMVNGKRILRHPELAQNVWLKFKGFFQSKLEDNRRLELEKHVREKPLDPESMQFLEQEAKSVTFRAEFIQSIVKAWTNHLRSRPTGAFALTFNLSILLSQLSPDWIPRLWNEMREHFEECEDPLIQLVCTHMQQGGDFNELLLFLQAKTFLLLASPISQKSQISLISGEDTPTIRIKIGEDYLHVPFNPLAGIRFLIGNPHWLKQERCLPVLGEYCPQFTSVQDLLQLEVDWNGFEASALEFLAMKDPFAHRFGARLLIACQPFTKNPHLFSQLFPHAENLFRDRDLVKAVEAQVTHEAEALTLHHLLELTSASNEWNNSWIRALARSRDENLARLAYEQWEKCPFFSGSFSSQFASDLLPIRLDLALKVLEVVLSKEKGPLQLLNIWEKICTHVRKQNQLERYWPFLMEILRKTFVANRFYPHPVAGEKTLEWINWMCRQALKNNAMEDFFTCLKTVNKDNFASSTYPLLSAFWLKWFEHFMVHENEEGARRIWQEMQAGGIWVDNNSLLHFQKLALKFLEKYPIEDTPFLMRENWHRTLKKRADALKIPLYVSNFLKHFDSKKTKLAIGCLYNLFKMRAPIKKIVPVGRYLYPLILSLLNKGEKELKLALFFANFPEIDSLLDPKEHSLLLAALLTQAAKKFEHHASDVKKLLNELLDRVSTQDFLQIPCIYHVLDHGSFYASSEEALKVRQNFALFADALFETGETEKLLRLVEHFSPENQNRLAWLEQRNDLLECKAEAKIIVASILDRTPSRKELESIAKILIQIGNTDQDLWGTLLSKLTEWQDQRCLEESWDYLSKRDVKEAILNVCLGGLVQVKSPKIYEIADSFLERKQIEPLIALVNKWKGSNRLEWLSRRSDLLEYRSEAKRVVAFVLSHSPLSEEVGTSACIIKKIGEIDAGLWKDILAQFMERNDLRSLEETWDYLMSQDVKNGILKCCLDGLIKLKSAKLPQIAEFFLIKRDVEWLVGLVKVVHSDNRLEWLARRSDLQQYQLEAGKVVASVLSHSPTKEEVSSSALILRSTEDTDGFLWESILTQFIARKDLQGLEETWDYLSKHNVKDGVSGQCLEGLLKVKSSKVSEYDLREYEQIKEALLKPKMIFGPDSALQTPESFEKLCLYLKYKILVEGSKAEELEDLIKAVAAGLQRSSSIFLPACEKNLCNLLSVALAHCSHSSVILPLLTLSSVQNLPASILKQLIAIGTKYTQASLPAEDQKAISNSWGCLVLLAEKQGLLKLSEKFREEPCFKILSHDVLRALVLRSLAKMKRLIKRKKTSEKIKEFIRFFIQHVDLLIQDQNFDELARLVFALLGQLPLTDIECLHSNIFDAFAVAYYAKISEGVDRDGGILPSQVIHYLPPRNKFLILEQILSKNQSERLLPGEMELIHKTESFLNFWRIELLGKIITQIPESGQELSGILKFVNTYLDYLCVSNRVPKESLAQFLDQFVFTPFLDSQQNIKHHHLEKLKHRIEKLTKLDFFKEEPARLHCYDFFLGNQPPKKSSQAVSAKYPAFAVENILANCRSTRILLILTRLMQLFHGCLDRDLFFKTYHTILDRLRKSERPYQEKFELLKALAEGVEKMLPCVSADSEQVTKICADLANTFLHDEPSISNKDLISRHQFERCKYAYEFLVRAFLKKGFAGKHSQYLACVRQMIRLCGKIENLALHKEVILCIHKLLLLIEKNDSELLAELKNLREDWLRLVLDRKPYHWIQGLDALNEAIGSDSTHYEKIPQKIKDKIKEEFLTLPHRDCLENALPLSSHIQFLLSCFPLNYNPKEEEAEVLLEKVCTIVLQLISQNMPTIASNLIEQITKWQKGCSYSLLQRLKTRMKKNWLAKNIQAVQGFLCHCLKHGVFYSTSQPIQEMVDLLIDTYLKEPEKMKENAFFWLLKQSDFKNSETKRMVSCWFYEWIFKKIEDDRPDCAMTRFLTFKHLLSEKQIETAYQKFINKFVKSRQYSRAFFHLRELEQAKLPPFKEIILNLVENLLEEVKSDPFKKMAYYSIAKEILDWPIFSEFKCQFLSKIEECEEILTCADDETESADVDQNPDLQNCIPEVLRHEMSRLADHLNAEEITEFINRHPIVYYPLVLPHLWDLFQPVMEGKKNLAGTPEEVANSLLAFLSLSTHFGIEQRIFLMKNIKNIYAIFERVTNPIPIKSTLILYLFSCFSTVYLDQNVPASFLENFKKLYQSIRKKIASFLQDYAFVQCFGYDLLTFEVEYKIDFSWINSLICRRHLPDLEEGISKLAEIARGEISFTYAKDCVSLLKIALNVYSKMPEQSDKFVEIINQIFTRLRTFPQLNELQDLTKMLADIETEKRVARFVQIVENFDKIPRKDLEKVTLQCATLLYKQFVLDHEIFKKMHHAFFNQIIAVENAGKNAEKEKIEAPTASQGNAFERLEVMATANHDVQPSKKTLDVVISLRISLILVLIESYHSLFSLHYADQINGNRIAKLNRNLSNYILEFFDYVKAKQIKEIKVSSLQALIQHSLFLPFFLQCKEESKTHFGSCVEFIVHCLEHQLINPSLPEWHLPLLFIGLKDQITSLDDELEYTTFERLMRLLIKSNGYFPLHGGITMILNSVPRRLWEQPNLYKKFIFKVLNRVKDYCKSLDNQEMLFQFFFQFLLQTKFGPLSQRKGSEEWEVVFCAMAIRLLDALYCGEGNIEGLPFERASAFVSKLFKNTLKLEELEGGIEVCENGKSGFLKLVESYICLLAIQNVNESQLSWEISRIMRLLTLHYQDQKNKRALAVHHWISILMEKGSPNCLKMAQKIFNLSVQQGFYSDHEELCAKIKKELKK